MYFVINLIWVITFSANSEFSAAIIPVFSIT